MKPVPRTGNQITLGALIDALRYLPEDKPVRIDCSVGSPGRPSSYRGYYEDLAIQPVLAGPPFTVSDLRTRLAAAVDDVFEAYKGGIYRATRDTLLWISNWGCADGNAVTGIRDERDRVVILTEKDEP